MNNPLTWDLILAQSPRNSIIAGGAPRDYFFGHEAKDYDVFYRYQPGLPINGVQGWNYVFRDVTNRQDYENMGGLENGINRNPIGCVYDYDVQIPDQGVARIQMIGVHYPDPIDMLENFDHTLTLGYYTGFNLVYDKRLVNDARSNEVHILKTQNLARTHQRIEAFAEKIGGTWRAIEPA